MVDLPEKMVVVHDSPVHNLFLQDRVGGHLGLLAIVGGGGVNL